MPSVPVPTNMAAVADEVAAYHDRLIEKGLDEHLVADVTRDLAHAVHHGHYPPYVAGGKSR